MGLNENELFIHLHIPKTAGTTMLNIIRRQFDPVRSAEIYPYWGMRDSINQIHDLPEELKKRLLCLQGHFVYGVHSYFD
mgnify:CR=1 FL=1